VAVVVLNAGGGQTGGDGSFECRGPPISSGGGFRPGLVVVECPWWSLVLAVIRECHGFMNPCGLAPRVVAGVGAGWAFVTPAQPIPMTQVHGFCWVV